MVIKNVYIKRSSLVKTSENGTFERSAVSISDRNLCLKTKQSVRFSDALVCSKQFGTEQKGPVRNPNTFAFRTIGNGKSHNAENRMSKI